MEINIAGIYDLITLLSKLPQHSVLNLSYGIAIISNFYFGNFAFLSRVIPESDFEQINMELNKFYLGQSYQVYCIMENRPFLTWLNKPIIEEPAMIYELNQNMISTPKDSQAVNLSKFPILKATVSDVNDLTEFMVRYGSNLNFESMKACLIHLITSEMVIFYIARHEGKLVGSRMIHYQQNGKIIQGNCNLVDPEYRRYGIATSLLTIALNEAKSKGVELFINQTTVDGYAFCKRFGCSQIGSYIYVRV